MKKKINKKSNEWYYFLQNYCYKTNKLQHYLWNCEEYQFEDIKSGKGVKPNHAFLKKKLRRVCV